jgi:Carboxypeptidase regulatory-like domain
MKSKLIYNCFLILVFAGLASATNFPQEVGRVKGKITDNYESVVTYKQVVFESKEKKYETKTNAIGEYSIELPAGIYKVTTSTLGFCPYQRALFRVSPSSQILINLVLYACPLANSISLDEKGNYKGELCRYVDAFTNESIQLQSQNIGSNILLIRFGEKQQDKDSVKYRGAKVSNDDYLGAMASYGSLTIYADTIRFNKDTLLLQGEGHVKLEDGSQQFTLQFVEVDFKAKNPLVTWTKK